MTSDITFLDVPYSQKNEAKLFGAKWNSKLSLWYVPQNVSSDNRKILLNRWDIVENKPTLKKRFITHVVRDIERYCMTDLYKIIPFELKMTYKNDLPIFPREIYIIDPALSGLFVDYLCRRIISEIKNISFEDKRSDFFLVDGIILESFEGEFHNEINRAYKKCRDMSNKSIDIMYDICLISFNHSIQCKEFNREKGEELLSKIHLSLDFTNDLYKQLDYLRYSENIELNPTICSSKYDLRGDADIIIDKTLIDFKLTKDIYKISYILQLISYIAIRDATKNNQSIKYAEIWNFFHGKIYQIDLSEWSLENKNLFVKFMTKNY